MTTTRLSTNVPDVAPHPATFTPLLLPIMAAMLIGRRYILDPFGGTGGIFDLGKWLGPGVQFEAVEIEPEWAGQDDRITCGNALDLQWDDGEFDAICTSPCYGNRMADHHNARDDSRRITYRHYLGRPLHPDNSGQLQWGREYRDFHIAAWAEAVRVLRPGGVFVLNVKDHIRGGERQDVVAFHLGVLLGLGLVQQDWIEVPVRGMGFGANRKARVDHEVIMSMGKWGCV